MIAWLTLVVFAFWPLALPSVGTTVSVIFPLLTILALGGCALLYGVQTTLRANNGDLEKRVAILEDEGKRKDAEIQAHAQRVNSQAGEIAALSKVITGEVHLVAITDLLTDHHNQAVAEWQVINAALSHIDVSMTGLLEVLRERS